MSEEICKCGHAKNRHGYHGCQYEYEHDRGIQCECVKFEEREKK